MNHLKTEMVCSSRVRNSQCLWKQREEPRIADMMFGGNLDNNYIIETGLNHITNKTLLAFIQQQSFSLGGNLDRIGVAFYIAPLINGVIRYGSMETKRLVFSCMSNNTKEEEIFYNGDKIENIYQVAAREAYNTKNRQKKIVDKSLEQSLEVIEEQKLNENQVIMLKVEDLQDDVFPTLTGLLANQIAAKYRRPTLVLRSFLTTNEENKTIKKLKGSGRGYTPLDSFRNALLDTGYMDYAAGHDNAFGVMFDSDNYDAITESLNTNLAEVEFSEPVPEVVYECARGINTEEKSMLLEFAKINHIFGNGIQKPKFMFKLFLNKKDIKWQGKKENTIKFNPPSNYFVTFIKFNAGKIKEQIEEIPTDLMEVVVIGEASINEFNGKKNLQIMITDIDFEPMELKKLF